MEKKKQDTSHIGVKEDGLQNQIREDRNISQADERFFTLLFIVNNVKGLGLFHLLFLGCFFL